MVQTFGKRIIGGIGAPGGGMSETFGAGVNTALNQRDVRQVMNFRAQDQAFKIEDREEAKRRRAAADAAAAAAKARTTAMNERYRSILGVPGAAPAVAGLTLPAATAAPGMARDRQGPAAAPAAAPAAPAAAGVRPAYTPLSFGDGNVITGGAGSASVGGGTGTDRLGAPAAKTFYTPGTGDLSARPGDFAARATAERLGAVAAAPSVAPENVTNTPELQVLQAEENVRAAQEMFDTFQDGASMARLAEAQAELRRLTPLVQDYTAATQGPYTDRGILAAEGPEATGMAATTAAPAPAVTTTAPASTAGVPPEVSVTLPDGQQLVLSTGTVAPTQPTQLTFGPKLGSPDRTQEDVFVDELMARTGADQRAPAPPAMGEPGAPNRAVTRLMSERDRQVQLAQAALEFNDMQTYQAAASKIMELDIALEAGVARMAISEARYSNAPQRLNAIWSEITGMQYEFVPTAVGVYDMYVNGDLYQQGVDMNVLAEETLMLADANYAQQQAALDQMRLEAEAKGMGQAEANIYEYGEKAEIDAKKALTVGLTEIDLLAMKRDLGFGEQDAIDFQKDEQTGIIMVFRNGEPTAQYRPVTEVDATGNEITRYEQVY